MLSRSILLRLLPALCVAMVLTGCAAKERQGPVVLAPASMQGVIEELADVWAAQGNARPVLSFAGSGALARQAERGAPADIIVSADAEWMDWLAARELVVPESRRVLAGNALSLISSDPADADGPIADLVRNMGDDKLAMGDPQSVPAGRYARAALQNMGLWDAVKDQIVPTENVRAALALVELGEARFGIVYSTDAAVSRRVHETARFDLRDVPEITYPAARLSAASHPQSDAFLEFLSSREAQDIYVAHGFTVHEPAP